MIESSNSYSQSTLARLGIAKSGWLIARPRCETCSERSFARRLSDGETAADEVYLQIANGQWGPPSAATWFPTESSARVYLMDFQPRYDQTLQLVYLCTNPGQHSTGWQSAPTLAAPPAVVQRAALRSFF